MIRSKNSTLYAKLTDAVWGRNRAIHRIELGILQLVAVDRNVGAIHLSARHRVGVTVIGDEVRCIPQRGDLIAERALPLYLGNHPGQIERVSVKLRQLSDHFVIENRGSAGLVRLQ